MTEQSETAPFVYVGFCDYGSEGCTQPFYVGQGLEALLRAYWEETHHSTFVIQKWATDGSGMIEEIRK